MQTGGGAAAKGGTAKGEVRGRLSIEVNDRVSVWNKGKSIRV
jgi:hypothetical protein